MSEGKHPRALPVTVSVTAWALLVLDRESYSALTDDVLDRRDRPVRRVQVRLVARTHAHPDAAIGLRGPARIDPTGVGARIQEAPGRCLAGYADLRAHDLDAVLVDDPQHLPADTCALIVLDGLHPDDDLDAGLRACRRTLGFARAFAPRALRGDAVFVTVQDTGGDFGLAGSPRAWLGGLPGLVKTAALEWPNVGARAIDLDLGELSAADAGAVIAQELLAGGLELEVALTPSAETKRRTLESYREDLDANADATPRLGPTDVVLASGGARGVTATTLVALARKTCARFVLLGRSPLAAEPASVRGLTADADLKRALLGDAKARGEANRALSEAQGYATERVNQAKGETARFNAILAEYRSAPEVTRTRMYLETLNSVLPQIGSVLVVQDGQTSPLPLLKLRDNQVKKESQQ